MCALPSITRNDAALARAMQESSDAALARELSQARSATRAWR